MSDTLVAVAVFTAAAWYRWGSPGAPYPPAGGLVYFTGTLVVTGLFNVPLNSALARVRASEPDAAARWAH